jgi:hypothetical protein
MNDRLFGALRGAFAASGLSVRQIYADYLSLGGIATSVEVDRFLHGAVIPGNHEFNVLAQALNERLGELAMGDAVPYAETHSATVGYSDVVPLLIAAAPSFDRSAEAERADAADGEYLRMTELVRHLIRLLDRGETASLPAVFGVVEWVLEEGDEPARHLITAGFLEDLLNPREYRPTRRRPSDFSAWLGPNARWMSRVATILGSGDQS